MKADCEGCEASAIMGATHVFETKPPCETENTRQEYSVQEYSKENRSKRSWKDYELLQEVDPTQMKDRGGDPFSVIQELPYHRSREVYTSNRSTTRQPSQRYPREILETPLPVCGPVTNIMESR